MLTIAVLSHVEPLECRTLFSTYFVDPLTGSDLNNGRSPRTPWQTLAAVNNHTFRRGDKVLLTGTFSGQSLVLGTNSTGVTVNSYSYNSDTKITRVGLPNIAAMTNIVGDGIDILASNVTVENLVLTADPTALSTGNYDDGIHLLNAGAITLSHEIIDNIIASGFSYSGLCMQGWNTSTADSAGFSNVLIENSTFFGNAVSGLFAAAGNSSGNDFQPEFPATLYLNTKLTIKNCKAYDNAGYNAALTGVADGDQFNKGNATSGGIFISSVNGAVVENCTVYNNNFNASGSVGTWAFDATHLLFQNDESYDNKNIAGIDGEGFDFDHGVTNSIMQRDYSHGNDGFGFLIASNGGSSNDDNNTIRYCVSDDDGQLQADSGIAVIGAAVPVLNANIYDNTVLAGSENGNFSSAVFVIDETAGDNIKIFNNIFFTTGGEVVSTDESSTAGLHFYGNDYWSSQVPGNFSVDWGGTDYNTLATWAVASGQETVQGALVGHSQDPDLVDETVSDLPMTGIGNLMLAAHSPLLREALNLNGARNRPYALSALELTGTGVVNVFDRRINLHALGAG
jgi:hypothetical protein